MSKLGKAATKHVMFKGQFVECGKIRALIVEDLLDRLTELEKEVVMDEGVMGQIILDSLEEVIDQLVEKRR